MLRRITVPLVLIALAGSAFASTSRSHASARFRSVLYIPHYDAPMPAAMAAGATHLVYAFADVDPTTGRLRARGGPLGTGEPQIHAMRVARNAHPGVKLMLGLGGGGSYSTNFRNSMGSSARRATVAANTAAKVRALGFDGVDLDWEFPDHKVRINGGPTETFAFTDFVTRLRGALDAVNPSLEISMAAIGVRQRTFDGAGMTNDYNWSAILPSIAFVNVMAYDLRGDWNAATVGVEGWDGGGTGFHNGLFDIPGDPNPGMSGNGYVHELERVGVPAAKLVLGVPFYGIMFCDVAPGPNGDGLRQHFTPGSCGAGVDRTPSFAQIVSFVDTAHGWHRYTHPVAKVRYAYQPTQRRFLTYENPASIRVKRAWASSNGLGGMMAWEPFLDTSSGALRQALVGAS